MAQGDEPRHASVQAASDLAWAGEDTEVRKAQATADRATDAQTAANLMRAARK